MKGNESGVAEAVRTCYETREGIDRGWKPTVEAVAAAVAGATVEVLAVLDEAIDAVVSGEGRCTSVEFDGRFFSYLANFNSPKKIINGKKKKQIYLSKS